VIQIYQGRLFQIAATGVRAGAISYDAIENKQPAEFTVKASNFSDGRNDYGVLNSAWALNTQLFRHNQVPHVPCDLESYSEYDTGTRKVLYRQHFSFWREQTYDASSTGNGVDPGTPYEVPLMAHAMPQMKQQSGWMSYYMHSCSVKETRYFPAMLENNARQFVGGAVSPGSLNIQSETLSYAAAEIHNHPTSSGETFLNFPKKTPIKSLFVSGFFSRWYNNILVPDVTSPVPAGYMYADCLNDQVIAASRDIYGYGNTSNAGLSSYGYLANRDVPRGVSGAGYVSITARQIPVFEDLVSGVAFMAIPEPNTDEGAVSVGDRATLPSLTNITASIRSDLPIFEGDRDLYNMRYSSSDTDVTYYHRVQGLRSYYTQLYDSAYANPAQPIHI